MNGDLKSIMRLILALAARYKPSSVKQSDAYRESPRGNKSVTEIAHVRSGGISFTKRLAKLAWGLEHGYVIILTSDYEM